MIEIDGLYFPALYSEYSDWEKIEAIDYRVKKLANDMALIYGMNYNEVKFAIDKALSAGIVTQSLSDVTFPNVPIHKRVISFFGRIIYRLFRRRP